MATQVTKLYLGETLGAILLGNIVAAIFYGITNMQTYIYYVRNRGDPLALKSLVFILWLLDSVHLAFITHTVYTYTITDFGDPLAITKPIWSVIAQVLVTCLSDMLIRGFFCHWVWKLSFRSRFIVAPIAASSLLAFVGGLVFDIKTYTQVETYFEMSKVSRLLYTSLGAAVVADVLIASSLCVLLRQRRTGFQRTDSILHLLMMYSINTGALTSICAISCLITYALMPDNFIFMAIYFVLAKLLLNSLLATLNARKTLRERNAGGVTTFPLTQLSRSRMMSDKTGEHFQSSDNSALGIQVHTSVVTEDESIPHVSKKGRDVEHVPVLAIERLDSLAM